MDEAQAQSAHATPAGTPAAERRSRPDRWRDDRGAIAVEFALIAPILALFLVGIVQFGMMFYLHNSMIAVANDVARRLAVGAVSKADVQSLVDERFASWNATFKTQVIEPSGDFVVRIRVPIKDVLPIDAPVLLFDGNLTAQAQMRKE